MSGRVLIIDDVSTNRIILKVKLASAYYDVIQASGLEDAAAALPIVRPDMILISSRLIKDDLERCLEKLSPEMDAPDTPILVLADKSDNSFRISVLQAGYDDILSSSVPENYLLARLRSLMRQRHHAQDMRQHSVAARALGFAESQETFAKPASITIVTDDPGLGPRFHKNLAEDLPHGLKSIGPDKLMNSESGLGLTKSRPDVLIADLRDKTRGDGLRFVADLRTSASIRDCPILPFVSTSTNDIAASLLDMGISDILFDDAAPLEWALRLRAQLAQKRAGDEMRDQIKDSLEAAVTDPLTGLYNRRYALSYLKCLLSTVGHEHRTFAVMVADLDHFKLINDSYGHAAGDTVLSRVAACLTDHVQDRDIVARIGGEEFLIVLPDTNRLKANAVAQNLCKAIQSMSLVLPKHADPVALTISIGVTLAKSSEFEGQSLDTRAISLMEQADRALYTSKAEGRNTVTLTKRSAA